MDNKQTWLQQRNETSELELERTNSTYHASTPAPYTCLLVRLFALIMSVCVLSYTSLCLFLSTSTMNIKTMSIMMKGRRTDLTMAFSNAMSRFFDARQRYSVCRVLGIFGSKFRKKWSIVNCGELIWNIFHNWEGCRFDFLEPFQNQTTFDLRKLLSSS